MTWIDGEDLLTIFALLLVAVGRFILRRLSA